MNTSETVKQVELTKAELLTTLINNPDIYVYAPKCAYFYSDKFAHGFMCKNSQGLFEPADLTLIPVNKSLYRIEVEEDG